MVHFAPQAKNLGPGLYRFWSVCKVKTMGDVKNTNVKFCAAGEKIGDYLPNNKNLNLELENNFKTIRTFAQNLRKNVLKGGGS